MATEVLNGFHDFVLFPQQRDDNYLSIQDPLPLTSSNLDQFYEDMASNYPQDFNALGSFYDPYHQEPGMTTGDLRFYETPRSQAGDGGFSTRNATSTSPSVSVSQSLDQAPSNLSHTSGASGQSTASSAVGSPYSQHQNLPAGQDQWIEMGLGIGGGPTPADMFAPSYYQLATTDADRVNFDEKFSGSFVGESTQLSQTVTSISPTVSSSVYSSPFSEPSSVASPLTTVSPDMGNFSKFQDPLSTKQASENSQIQSSFITNPGWSVATPRQSSSSFSSSSHHRDSQIHNSFFAQSSGNFVAPLESSCWFSLIPFPYTSI